MFVRLLSLAVLLQGCGEPGPLLSRLTQAWSDQTISDARAGINGTLVLAGLAADLCPVLGSDEWMSLEEGDLLPIDVAFSNALGSPSIVSVDTSDESNVSMTIEGIDIGGRDDAGLRLTVTRSEESEQFEITAFIADGGEEQVDHMGGFAQVSVAISTNCTDAQAFGRGTAIWKGARGRNHELKIPADDLDADLNFNGAVPWLPSSGTVFWSDRGQAQARSVTTEQANAIEVDDSGNARWPATVRGPDWTGTGVISVAP